MEQDPRFKPELESTEALLRMLPEQKEGCFVMKLYRMLNCNEYPEIVHWSKDGTFFKIERRAEFISIVLKKYFGGVKMTSFLRQLNMYGFTKDEREDIKYSHPYFTRSNPALLKLVKRRLFPVEKKKEEPLAALDKLEYDSGAVESGSDATSSMSNAPQAPSKKFSIVVDENPNEPSSLSSALPVVSPHLPSSQQQGKSTSETVTLCKRCAQVEALFAQEDPFHGVFEIESNTENTRQQEDDQLLNPGDLDVSVDSPTMVPTSTSGHFVTNAGSLSPTKKRSKREV